MNTKSRNELTALQQKYFSKIWWKGIMKLSDLKTNSEEYILVYDRIIASLEKTRYIAKNPNNKRFSKNHESADVRMNVI